MVTIFIPGEVTVMYADIPSSKHEFCGGSVNVELCGGFSWRYIKDMAWASDIRSPAVGFTR
jgi:hypothetical protein